MNLTSVLRVGVLCLVVYVTCGFVVPDTDTAGDHNREVSDGLARVLLTPREAKVIHRVKRWGGFKTITGEEEEEEEEGGRERTARANLQRQCQASCWGAWKPFGGCSVECGTHGKQYSTRDRSVSSQCAAVINSHGCPGSNTRSRSCTKRCENGGVLGTTSCSCPAGFRGACCKTRVTCGFPGKPSNGGVSNAASSHNYNTRVTYSCSTGYTLQGSGDNLCLASGQWKNTAPTCRRVTCSKPSLHPHVSITPSRSNYDYGSRVVYACAEGYRRQGAESAQCQSNQGAWSHPSPTCAEIRCPSLAAPSHGSVSPSGGATFRGVATYTCDLGYHLAGSRTRTCQVSGQWDGTAPTCQRVTCPRLSAPTHGKVTQPSSAGKDASATYSCDSGYELRGNQRRTCNYGNSATGSWSGTTPSCSAVSCGQPQTPTHGTRTGTTFTFSSRVSFRCEAGYYLAGAEVVTCQADKQWSQTNTRCTACPRNKYKSEVNAARVCTHCPSNSFTTASGSTQRSQCVCNHGYEGSNGGPCSVIKCPALVAPSHGTVGACALNYQNTCSVTCMQGYIRHGGDETRTCLLNKKWSGTPPTCKACPRNTYKSGPSECSNCPVNSVTAGEASSRTDCVCKAGFSGQPGDKCADINECATNNGGCEHICINLPGVHTCECRTGFVRDSSNNKKCVAKNTCPALDRPSFGGLVCLAQVSTRTERCSVKCNPGYQHIIRPNQWEQCGPSTNFRWTTEANMTPILGCIESFFDEIFIDGEAAYFTTSCDQVTGSTLQEVQQAFVRMLKSKGICATGSAQATCPVEDVTVSCGSRQKRDVTSTGNAQLNIKFKVKVPSKSKVTSGCPVQCHATREVVLFDDCYAQCEAAMEKERQAELTEAKNRLTLGVLVPSGSDSGSDGSRTGRRQKGQPQATASNMFISGGLLSRPAGVAEVSDIRASCDAGMERRNGTCVPCPAGSYLRAASTDSQSGACVLCPQGQYQPRARQTTCIRCPEGKHSPRGATSCTITPTEEPVDFFVVIKPKET